jgi:hypothetical protein
MVFTIRNCALNLRQLETRTGAVEREPDPLLT